MRLTVFAVGKLKEPFFREGCGFYQERIRPFCPVEVVEGEKERSSSQRDIEVAYLGLRKRYLACPLRVALEVGGRQMDSPRLARFLGQALDRGTARAGFLVGGPHGLPPLAREDSTASLSLSPLTLPHQLARMVLLEQLYRSLTLLKGIPYHK